MHAEQTRRFYYFTHFSIVQTAVDSYQLSRETPGALLDLLALSGNFTVFRNERQKPRRRAVRQDCALSQHTANSITSHTHFSFRSASHLLDSTLFIDLWQVLSRVGIPTLWRVAKPNRIAKGRSDAL